MPTCFTVSLSLSLPPTHLFKFQVRFQVASRDSVPSQEQTRGCEYNVVHGKDIAVIDSSLCQCWSNTRRARSPPCSQPTVDALICLSAPGEADRGIKREFGGFFGSPFYLSHKISQLQAGGGCWVKEKEHDFSWSWVCSCGACSQHSCLLMCAWSRALPGLICQHGWYSYNKHPC